MKSIITQCINSLPVSIESIVLIPREKQLNDNLITFIELFNNLEKPYKNILFDFTRESSQEMDVHIEAFSIYIIENYLKNKPLFPQEMRVAISINDKILKQLNARGNDINLNAVINLFAQKTNIQLQIHNELNTSNALPITTLQTHEEIQEMAPSTTDNIVMALASKYIATYFPEGQITLNSKKRPHSALEETTLSPERQLSLIHLNSANNYQSAFSSIKSLPINDDIMHLSLYSALSESPLSRRDCCYFIMAGRKELALVPPKSTTRCIIVLTEAEFNQLYPQQMIPPHYDFLVIHSFTPRPNARLSAITIRRRAALHCAYVLDLPHFIMMDDNIKSLNYQNQDSSLPYTANEAYQEFLTLLIKAQEPLISLPTKANNNVIKANQNVLGSKVFLFNMELIRQLLPNTLDALALFPSNEESFGEDYFMQLMLHMLCKEKLQDQRQGFQIVDNKMSITRDQTDINSCLTQGIQARPLDYPSNQITLIDMQIQRIHHRTIALFNDKLSKMIALITHSQNHKKNIDLSQQAAKQLHQNTLPAMPKPTRPFKQQLKFNLQNALKEMSTLYPHQRAALEFLQENLSAPHATRFNFDIATGCGKTLIQSTIAFHAFLANSNKQHGIIVCPTIQLTEQMKQALLDNATQLLSPELQAVIMPRIHAVCTTELSISTVLLNKSLQEPCLFVICQASYNELLEQPLLISQFGFIIHDESHKVEKEEHLQKIIQAKTDQLPEDIKYTPQMSTFSFSATPKQTNEPFTFCYTREQGINDKILAPLILDASFSEDSFSPEHIAYLLNNHRTPNNHLLKTQKGIIYVSSKEKVNTLIQKIQSECPDTPFFEIHSGQINPYEIIKQFKQSNHGVAIVIGMLIEGFDDPSVNWLLINKKTLSKENGIQIIGRILRKNNNAPQKIGLAIMPRVLNQKHLNEQTTWPKNEMVPNPVQKVQETLHKINQHKDLHQLSIFAHSINKAQSNESDNNEQAIAVYEEERQFSDNSFSTT